MKKSKSQRIDFLLNALTVLAVALIVFSSIMLTGKIKATERENKAPPPLSTAIPQESSETAETGSVIDIDTGLHRDAPMSVKILGNEEFITSEEYSVLPNEGRDNLDSTQNSSSSPSCVLEIDCSTILGNMAKLSEGKEIFVPSNGLILAASTIALESGDTAFDVLKRACLLADIQLEYSWTPLYDSYYIEGINNLYEFDCGEQSGWMYKVNGVFPDYGCSEYVLKDGDSVVFCFTCAGLGADVGGSVW